MEAVSVALAFLNNQSTHLGCLQKRVDKQLEDFVIGFDFSRWPNQTLFWPSMTLIIRNDPERCAHNDTGGALLIPAPPSFIRIGCSSFFLRLLYTHAITLEYELHKEMLTSGIVKESEPVLMVTYMEFSSRT